MMYDIEKNRFIKNNSLSSIVNSFIVDSPIASNISYLWGFGSILGLCLVLQIITGISLSFHYIPETTLAFDSVENIMRNEMYGWLLRYLHSNGAGLFFIFVYLHISRNLYYGSYVKPRILLWNMGIIIYVLMMATAFIGYVLVWGSMSLWGAIVITNFFSAIPWIGEEIVQFIWGGFSVDNPTLNRFYGLHFLLPFIIAFSVILHLIGLHDHGSNNPIGFSSNSDKISFHPYLTYKDIVGFILFFIFLIFVVGFLPNYLGHSDNYIKANPLVTPVSIVPEFYFLPFYAILRSIPNKLAGVIVMACSIAFLFLLPWIQLNEIRTNSFRILNQLFYWIFVSNFILLMIIGALPVEYPFSIIGPISCALYFIILFVFPILIGSLETYFIIY